MMLEDNQKNQLLQVILDELALPESAYQKAEDRYNDIGSWLCREESTCSQYEPKIFSQGSFRLGTAIRPLTSNNDYDLDLVSKLQKGLTKNNISQEDFKNLVGKELEAYRNARGIQSRLKPKHRCWRLEYADNISFHMDIIPCIPESDTKMATLKQSLLLEYSDSSFSDSLSSLAVAITDDRHNKFSLISDDWETSNPEGYATWFESRMKLATQYLTERAIYLNKAHIDDLPYYRWRSPLQSAIQLLKRHRDIFFKSDSDLKPISIIITTLAAHSYNGESDLYGTLNGILNRLDNFIRPNFPRVPNPTDPNEDFADRWASPEGRELRLEENFYRWLKQARIDFGLILNESDVDSVYRNTDTSFGIRLNKSLLVSIPGINNFRKDSTREIITKSHRPWRS